MRGIWRKRIAEGGRRRGHRWLPNKARYVFISLNILLHFLLNYEYGCIICCGREGPQGCFQLSVLTCLKCSIFMVFHILHACSARMHGCMKHFSSYPLKYPCTHVLQTQPCTHSLTIFLIHPDHLTICALQCNPHFNLQAHSFPHTTHHAHVLLISIRTLKPPAGMHGNLACKPLSWSSFINTIDIPCFPTSLTTTNSTISSQPFSVQGARTKTLSTPTTTTTSPSLAMPPLMPRSPTTQAQLGLAGPVHGVGGMASGVTQSWASCPLAPQPPAPPATHPAAPGAQPLTSPSHMTRGPSLRRPRRLQGSLEPHSFP